MKKFRFLYTCLFLVMIAVACLVDLKDTADKIPTFYGFDKVVHGGMYFVLSYLFIWEYRDRKRLLPNREGSIYESGDHLYRIFWFVLLLCIVFGGAIEFLQGLTSYRGKEMADLTADVMGGLFAYLIYYVLVMTNRKQ